MSAGRAERREAIATRMMAAIYGVGNYHTFANQAHDAVGMANALMAELDKHAEQDAVCGCSRGEPKEAEPTQDDTELLQAKVDFHRRNSSERLDEIGRLNLELWRLRQFASRVQCEAVASPRLYAPFVALVRDLEATEVST